MDDQEREIFLRTAGAFRTYPEFCRKNIINPIINARKSLSPTYRSFGYQILDPHIVSLKAAVAANAYICTMASNAVKDFVGDSNDPIDRIEPTDMDRLKVNSVLRQLVREWTKDGETERLQSFGPIIAVLNNYFPDKIKRKSVRILVPGSGLGRLPFELSVLGFEVIGNEFNPHMLIITSLIFNSTFNPKRIPLYPYIHSQSHWRKRADQLLCVQVPDIDPNTVAESGAQSGSMSMGIGDFYEIDDVFDVCVTCFFIDAPYNFFKTLDTITKVVEIGGLWINLGPLHWHSEESCDSVGDEPVIGLALEDVFSLIQCRGWKILEQSSGIPCTYCSTHPDRMGYMVFQCEFWVAQRIK